MQSLPVSSASTLAPPSHPRLYTTSDLIANSALSTSIITLVNTSYQDPAVYPLDLWPNRGTDFIRYKTHQELYDCLGPHGRIAVVFNGEDETEAIACAGANPWGGDRVPATGGEGDRHGFVVRGLGESGWEIKPAATDSRWGKRGLASSCMDALVRDIASSATDGDKSVRLWIHAVEEVNADYWKRRGWKEVRRSQMPLGQWGSNFAGWLVVMVKDVDVRSLDEKAVMS